MIAALETLWLTLAGMAPYLILGFALAGVLSVFAHPEQVRRHLGHGRFAAVLKASLLGVPLPLCSCSVIPVAASLRKQGASRGATISFLTSTPQTGVDSILVTYGMLGPLFAVYRPVLALVTGLLGGLGVSAATPREQSVEDAPDADAVELTHGARWRAAMRYAFIDLPSELAGPLLAGVLVAALLTLVLGDGSVSATLGTGIGAMLAMLVLSVPMYVCATASVPIAAALMAKGLTPGAALVFLMAGPATNVATIGTVWKLMGVRTSAIYLATIVVGALMGGAVLDVLWMQTGAVSVPGAAHDHVGWLGHLSAVVLCVMLGRAFVQSLWARRPGSPVAAVPRDLVLRVDGMTCGGCAKRVGEAVRSCAGVEGVDVDHGRGRVAIGGAADADVVTAAIERAGYTVRGEA